uniref:Uncharacterized protein n=1 Tax=Panagrellus redivivus TaxID=6233 RepID=A0A7E4V9S6_PANRE
MAAVREGLVSQSSHPTSGVLLRNRTADGDDEQARPYSHRAPDQPTPPIIRGHRGRRVVDPDQHNACLGLPKTNATQ